MAAILPWRFQLTPKLPNKLAESIYLDLISQLDLLTKP